MSGATDPLPDKGCNAERGKRHSLKRAGGRTRKNQGEANAILERLGRTDARWNKKEESTEPGGTRQGNPPYACSRTAVISILPPAAGCWDRSTTCRRLSARAPKTSNDASQRARGPDDNSWKTTHGAGCGQMPCGQLLPRPAAGQGRNRWTSAPYSWNPSYPATGCGHLFYFAHHVGSQLRHASFA